MEERWSYSRIRNGNGGMALDEVQRIFKSNFEDLHNMDTQEQVAVHM